MNKLPGEAAEAAEQISILEGHGHALMQTDATFRQQPDLLPGFQCRIQRQIQPLWVISRKLNYISGVQPVLIAMVVPYQPAANCLQTWSQKSFPAAVPSW